MLNRTHYKCLLHLFLVALLATLVCVRPAHAAVPTVTNAMISSSTAGAAGVTLTLTGTNFNETTLANNSVLFNGTPLATQMVTSVMPGATTTSGTSLTATITLPTTSGTYAVTVNNINGTGTGTTNTVTVNAAAATKIVITAPAAGAIETVGTPFTVTAEAEDPFDNVDLTYASAANIALSPADSGASGLTTHFAAGTATFSVTLTVPQAETLTVHSGGLTTDSVAVTARVVATKIVITAPAPGAIETVGMPFTVTAEAEDASGNIDSAYGTAADITLSAADGGASGLTTSFVAGTATFSVTLTVPQAETLTVHSGTLTTAAVTVTARVVATKIVITAPTAGAIETAGTSFPVTAEAEDASGNIDSAYASPANITLSAADSGASGLTMNFAAGTATFSVTLTKAQAETLTVHSGSLTTDAVAVTVDANTATKIIITTPATGAMETAGTSFPVTAKAEDSFDNVNLTYTSPANITLSAADSGASGLTMNFAAGTATFSVTLTKAQAETLTVHSGSLTTDAVTVTVGADALMGMPTITTQPTPNPVTAGTAFDVKVTVKDQFNNLVPNAPVTLTINQNTFAGGATVASATANGSGVADFNTLVIDKAATGYTFTPKDTTSGITGTASTPALTVKPATSHTVTVTNVPDQIAGAAFTVTATVTDIFGNAVSNGTSVKLALTAGPGPLVAGTTTSMTTAGIVSFPGLVIDKAGTNYQATITAQDTGAATNTSNTFNVGAAAASLLDVRISPASAPAGANFTVTVTAEDAFFNIATDETHDAVTHPTDDLVTISSDSEGDLPLTQPLTAGQTTFHSVSLTTIGSAIVTAATTTNEGSAISGIGNVQVTRPSGSTVTHFAVTAPTTVIAGVAFTVTVTALDGFNNVVPTYTGTVALSSANGITAASATLTAGVGTFSVTLSTAGAATVTASDASGNTGASGGISVLPVIASVAPATAVASVTPISFTITAESNTFFAPNSTVQFAGNTLVASAPLTVTQSADNATITVAGFVLPAPGSYPVTVTNPAGGASNALAFVVVDATPTPIPKITGITPASVLISAPNQSVTLAGSNFDADAKVTLTNPATGTLVPLGTPTVTAGSISLTFSVPPGAGTYNFQVENPAFPQSVPEFSNTQALLVENPAPTITKLTTSPSPASAGADLVLTITGTGFVANTTTVSLGTLSLIPTVVSSQTMTVAIRGSEILTQGNYSITVVNPPLAGTSPPQGGGSALATLIVGPPAIGALALSPGAVLVGSGPLSLIITGTGFTSSSTVTFGGNPLSSPIVAGNTITVNIPGGIDTGTLLNTAGNFNIVVSNGTGSSSAPAVFLVEPRNPANDSNVPLAVTPALDTLIASSSTGTTGTLQMFSVPFSYVRDPIFTPPVLPAGNVLDEVTQNSGGFTDFYTAQKLAAWDAATNAYVVTPVSPTNALVLGQGYWIRAKYDAGLAGGVPGNYRLGLIRRGPTAQETANQPGSSYNAADQTYAISLQKGWNMIGDPFDSQVSVINLKVQGTLAPDTKLGITQADTAGVASAVLYRYDATAKSYVAVSPPGAVAGADSVLYPYVGYWILAYRACTLYVPTQ